MITAVAEDDGDCRSGQTKTLNCLVIPYKYRTIMQEYSINNAYTEYHMTKKFANLGRIKIELI